MKYIYEKCLDNDKNYVGALDEAGQKKGFGKMRIRTEAGLTDNSYEGNWTSDTDGEGTMTDEYGNVFVGSWSYDKKKDGLTRVGKMTFQDGEVFEGRWEGYDNSREGPGKYSSSFGDIYEGTWVNDRYSLGKLIYRKTKVPNYKPYSRRDTRYDRELLEIDGDIDDWLLGTTYEGRWLVVDQTEFFVNGKMTFPDGRTFNGNWTIGRMQSRYERYGFSRKPQMIPDFGEAFELTGNWDGFYEYPFNLRERPLQGVAYEVHNEALKIFDKKFWQSYYGLIETRSVEKHTDDYFNELPKMDFREKIEGFLKNLIEKSDLMDEKKYKNDELQKAFDKLFYATEYCNKKENRIMMGRTIELVGTLDKDFQDLYIEFLIEDCIHAYAPPNTPTLVVNRSSCPKGIVEKIVLMVNKTVEYIFFQADVLTPEGTVDTEKYINNGKFHDQPYLKLYRIFNKIMRNHYPENMEFNNKLKQEWVERGWKEKEGKSWSEMDENARKQNYVNYMISKYKEFEIDYDGLQAHIEAETNASLKYIFEQKSDTEPTFGGRRRTLKKRKMKKRKTHIRKRKRNLRRSRKP